MDLYKCLYCCNVDTRFSYIKEELGESENYNSDEEQSDEGDSMGMDIDVFIRIIVINNILDLNNMRCLLYC